MNKLIGQMSFLCLLMMLLMPVSSSAKTYKGTINIQIGETYHVDIGYGSGYTVSGYWTKTDGSAFIITSSSSGNGGCTIKGNQVGTSTLNWTGVVSGGWSTWDEEWYWTVNVKDGNTITGKCGENVTYSYNDKYSTLTISGNGDMYDFNDSGTPWVNYKEQIKKVVVNYGVTSIGGLAFSNTGNIDISIPSTVKYIGDRAFERSAITSINIGDGVTSIGLRAFAECTSLSSLTIPDNVVTIGSYAFSGCTALRSLTLGQNVSLIDGGAFSKCSNLTGLIIPDRVETIGDWAFSSCSGLKNVTIGKGITSISSDAFYHCDNIMSVTIHCKEIGYLWFNGVKSIKEIIIGDEVKSIGGTDYHDGAFERYINLSKVTIGNSVEHIGTRTFGKCSGLTTVTIPNSVKTIGQQAFWACSGLTSIVLPDQIATIEQYTFDGCSSLTSLSIPSSVTSIEEFAFNDCRGLKEVRSYIKVPFEIPTSCFNNVNTASIPLYVPARTKAKYEATEGWKLFKNIIEMEGSDEIQPENISIPSPMTVVAGQTITLIPTITPSDAVTTLTWTSDDETIATVNSEGVVTGVKKGQTFINVETDNGKSAFCKLTVTAPQPIEVSIPKSATVNVGETITLTATLTPQNAATTLTWMSDDPAVATVDANGTVTGIAAGLAIIQVTTANGLTSNPCKLTVNPSTGIKNVNTDNSVSSQVFSLSGQRLAAPKKGINIVGGKKVIVK